jgi:hypothetical protein
MRWRDIRFEKPTAADGDEVGSVLQKLENGGVCVADLESLAYMVAWMPLSELPAFDPIPDPPEGWRFVEKGEAFDKRAKCWCKTGGWQLTQQLDSYDPEMVYIIPINPPKPPEPQYRPFANREEAMARFDDRVVRKKSGNISRISTVGKTSCRIGATPWDYDMAFDEFAFADGTPFGIEVQQ